MIVKPFKPTWQKLKKKLSKEDLRFFYEVVNINGTVGRTVSTRLNNAMAENPNHMVHWFATSRCHLNVIFPCWLLNERRLTGKYKIITNDKHSAIINTETNEIYDPTYATWNNEDSTLGKFETYEFMDVLSHSLLVGWGIYGRLRAVLSEEDDRIADEIISKRITK
jgi:hypothetical protein